MRSRLLGVGLFSLIAFVAVFVALRLLGLRGDLASIPDVERPELLIPGFALLGAAPLAYALLWREIVSRLDGTRAPAVDAVAVFCASWLGRYVPTSLPYFAGKFALGMRLGIGKPALAASILYENALFVSIGAASSSVLIPLSLTGEAGQPLVYAGAGLGGLAALGLLSPPVLHRAINAAARFARRDPVPRKHLLSYRGILSSAAWVAVGLAINGAGFALLLNAFVPLDARELVASAAIFNLAGVAGVAAVPVPSGIGVREAVLIGLLQVFVPLEVAVAAAVLTRLVGVLGDVALGLAGAATLAIRQRPSAREASAAQRAEDAVELGRAA